MAQAAAPVARESTQPLLSLRGLSKSFGAVRALHDVDLDVPAGQVTALAGDNGAGKTPPASLVNATTKDTKANADIKSVYTVPTWVTTDNMASTVVKDNAITTADLCTGALSSACQAVGINP